jgi:hypothetical protein
MKSNKKINQQLENLFSNYTDEQLEDLEIKYVFSSTPPCYDIQYQEEKITLSMITQEIKRRKDVRIRRYLLENVPLWLIIAIVFFCFGHFYK